MRTGKVDADFLKSHVQYKWSDICVFDSLDSTSNWVKSQSTDKLVCIAEHQTAGRGRHGHQWQSPDAENIYLSFSWQFDGQPNHLSLLSLWVGIIIAETLSSVGLSEHGIKWPNDIYWKKQKMGGILLETSNLAPMIIVGIGLNINMQQEGDIDQPWVSLNQAMGKAVNRHHILPALLDNLHLGLSEFESLTAEQIKQRWKKWDLILGRNVSFLERDTQLCGEALGIDDSGQLQVRLESGEVKAFGTTISKVRW